MTYRFVWAKDAKPDLDTVIIRYWQRRVYQEILRAYLKLHSPRWWL